MLTCTSGMRPSESGVKEMKERKKSDGFCPVFSMEAYNIDAKVERIVRESVVERTHVH
jgi:hypothetical protein